MQNILTLTARMTFVLAVCTGFVIVFFGDWLLKYTYGLDYVDAYLPLIILVIGQIINSGFGAVTIILNMTGHERDTLIGVSIAVIINIVMNILLIPMYGIIGASIATVITLLCWNVLLFVAVKKRLCLNPTFFKA